MNPKTSTHVTNDTSGPRNGEAVKKIDMDTIDAIEGRLWVGYQRLLSSRSSLQPNLNPGAVIDAVQVTMAVIKNVRADAVFFDGKHPTRGK